MKRKLDRPTPARDLYTSPLFLGRRRYVERTCGRWFILSALHGLVAPDALLEPYDQTLRTASVAERQAWSRRVLEDPGDRLGGFRGLTVEIHAGASYREHGLVSELVRAGARVENPTEGLRFGEQLAFYASGSSPARSTHLSAPRADDYAGRPVSEDEL